MAQGGPAYRAAAGSTLRRLRAERGWSLRTLSERSGISVPYLSEIERGRKEPSGAMLTQIASAFDLSLARLLALVAGSLGEAAVAELAAGERVPPALAEAIRTLDPEALAELARYAEYLMWRRREG